MKNITFIVGSLRKQSFNRQLAALSETMLSDRFNITYLEFGDVPQLAQLKAQAEKFAEFVEQ